MPGPVPLSGSLAAAELQHFVSGAPTVPRLPSLPCPMRVQECWTMVADKAHRGSQQGVAALASALSSRGQLAVLRYVPRAGGAVHLCAAAPVPRRGAAPAHFLLLDLPFAEDVRDFRFPGFDREDRRPTPAAADAALRFVDAAALIDPGECLAGMVRARRRCWARRVRGGPEPLDGRCQGRFGLARLHRHGARAPGAGCRGQPCAACLPPPRGLQGAGRGRGRHPRRRPLGAARGRRGEVDKGSL